MTIQVQWLVAARRHMGFVGSVLRWARYPQRTCRESIDQGFEPSAYALRGSYFGLLTAVSEANR